MCWPPECWIKVEKTVCCVLANEKSFLEVYRKCDQDVYGWHLHTVPLVTYVYMHSIAPEYVIFLVLLYLNSKSHLLSISLSTFYFPLQHLSSFSLQLSHLHPIYPPPKDKIRCRIQTKKSDLVKFFSVVPHSCP